MDLGKTINFIAFGHDFDDYMGHFGYFIIILQHIEGILELFLMIFMNNIHNCIIQGQIFIIIYI